jgi:hypothetical protein
MPNRTFRPSSGHGQQNVSNTRKSSEELDMDRYTKTLFTIIAVALVWIALKDTAVISNAMASTGVLEVKIVEMNLSRYRPLPVRVQGEIKCTGG